MMSSVNMHVYNTEHNEPSLAQVYKHDAPSSIANMDVPSKRAGH